MKKVWLLDPHDKSLPDGLKDEIFDNIQAGEMSNDSVSIVSINILKEWLIDDFDDESFSCPLLIKFLEDQGLGDNEDVYIHIWW